MQDEKMPDDKASTKVSEALQADQPGRMIAHHFWAASYPFFTSTIFILPSIEASSVQVPEEEFNSAQSGVAPDPRAEVTLYDCDGDIVNEVQLQFPKHEIGILEFEPLMSSCKLESGLKHVHVRIDCCEGIRPQVRIHSAAGASLIGEPFLVKKDLGGFAPVSMSSARSSLVSLSNYGEEEAIVRVRFCVGKRMPEINCHVPARGCRLVSLESEFPEFCQDHSTELTAYLRFSCKSDAGVGVQVLECSRLSAANGPRLNIFSAIT